MVGLCKPDGGVQPVGIGDVNHCLEEVQIILSVRGQDETEACSSNQLWAGLQFGCEGHVRIKT